MTQPEESVEIKVNLRDVTSSLRVLGLSMDEGTERSVWFLEDRSHGDSPLTPLLGANVIVRLRTTTGDDDDSTVKLRPCLPPQLTDDWRKGFEAGRCDYGIEGDWSGDRHVLAASCKVSLTRGEIEDVLESSDADLPALFDVRQQQLLDECADIRVAFSELTPLGPIQATVWKKARLADLDFDLDVSVERWEVAGLDFLELSTRVKPDDGDPAEHQRVLEEYVTRMRLVREGSLDPKTSQVLKRLAEGVP